MRIEIEGRQAAQDWQRDAKILNEETKTLLTEVSNTLKSVREFSEGSLVDEIVDLGDTLVTATTKLMQGMNGIFDVVNGLLDFLGKLISNSSKEVSNTKNYIN